ncbi:hypothetical protein PS15p_210259 [Mucor circinelloides]
MGNKPSSTSAAYNTTKRKRSNTQASHHSTHLENIKTVQEPTRTSNTRMIPAPAQVIIPKFNTQQCEQLFQRYADQDSPDVITPDGTRQFFEDLGLSIEDVLIFAIAWKMHTSTMGYITKDEWMFGMKELETDSIEKLRAKRSDFEKVFHDPEQFKEMYKYTFTYAKNRDQKCMEIETASVLWTMLLSERYPIVNDFVSFLQEKKPVKVINRDQWQSFLEFASTDIDDYDESSAWPVLFDEFVEWRKEQS